MHSPQKWGWQFRPEHGKWTHHRSGGGSLEQNMVNALTTEVGVAVFSVTLNSSVSTLKLQMSSPEPENAVQIPPTNPVNNNTTTFHTYNDMPKAVDF